MWGDARICIRRILRMWDPALVCNPMQDLGLPTIQYQWWGACLHCRCEVWLTHSCLLEKVRTSNADWALTIIPRSVFFFFLHLSCNKYKTHSCVIPVWNLELFLFSCHWEVTWMSTSLFPTCPQGVPLTSPDLLPSDGTWGHHDSSRGH